MGLLIITKLATTLKKARGYRNLSRIRHLRLGVCLVALSVFALLILDFVPGGNLNDAKYLNATISYLVLGVVFYLANYLIGSQSLEYFRLPRVHVRTVLALVVASPFMIQAIKFSDNVYSTPEIVIRGVIFLLAIGFGEEMVCRGLFFGVIRKFGQKKAIFVSSLLFGLMHLNHFVASDWDSWLAYWRVVETFSFGLLACALMIATRSIWVVVIFHAICDWRVVFDKPSPTTDVGAIWNPSLWEGITSPLFALFLQGGYALLLLWVNRASIPNWFYRLAIKWKLVEPMMHSFASSVTSTKPNFL